MTVPQKTDRLIDRTLGDFVIREKLGQGAFGVVYRAEQPTLAREAVVKLLHPTHQANPAIIERFLREARLASRLDHPFAAHIYAFGAEPDGVLWIAMELVRGTPLDELLRAQGPIPLLRFAPLLERLCEVVNAAHDQGIVHRDLKPANVMVVSRAGRLSPKLLDLGVAKFLDLAGKETPVTDEDDGAATSTRGGTVLGSPSYMAPEQWVDPASVDARTDLYALGVLTFEALTGRLPFTGATVKAVAAAHARDPMPPLGPAFPAELEALLARVTAKQPGARPASALEFAAAFRAAAGLGVEKQESPQLEESLRRTLVGGAPQPLAEAVAAMEASSNVHQAREALSQVCRVAIRWIGLVALSCRMHVRPSEEAERKTLSEAMRALRRRTLSDEEWLELARELCRPFAGRADAHPVPELVSLFFPRNPADAAAVADLMDGIVAVRATLKDGAAGSEDRVREQLGRELPLVEKLLAALAFFWDYPLVVARGTRAERWMGTRRAQRATLELRGNAVPTGRPFLVDAASCPMVSLWPLVQVLAPTPGADEEVFFLEGRGRTGARLVALPGGFERHDEATWDWLRDEARGDGQDGDEGESEDDAPYRGLSSFTPGDARHFFGREREVEAFVNRLRVQPLMALVGPSGAGKTSFVQAGVVPRLPDSWQAITMRPGPAPLATLLGRLGQHGIDAADLPRTLTTDADALGALLRRACHDRQTALVLVIDQFEELFTLCRSEEERELFALALARAARAPEDPVRVVLALRDDFLIRSQMLPPLHDRLVQGLQLLATPAAAELERILTEPARLCGYDFEDRELPTEMVREVVDRPGALALLSFTASKLWELRDHTFRQLTRKTYRSLGGVGGALARHADATLNSLMPAEQALVREAFRHLVTAEGTRAVLRRGELERVLGGGARALGVVERLVAARLVVTSEGEGGEDRVEVIHEALLSAWPLLVAWRKQDEEGAHLHDQLREAARQWIDRGRPRGLLWRDDVLVEYQRWRKRYSGRLTEGEDAFAAASLAEASRGRRARGLAMAAALVGLVGGLVALMVVNRQAVANAKEAHQRLLALYQEQGRQWLHGGDPRRALAYLVRAYSDGAGGVELPFLIGQAQRELTLAEVSLDGHGDALTWVTFSRDGARVATASGDASARIWDARTGALLATMPGHEGIVNHVELSPDGERVATASRDGSARVWDARGRLLYRVAGDAGNLSSVARVHWSPDGKRLLVCRSVGATTLVNGADGALVATFGVSPNGAFSPDGSRVLVAAGEGFAAIRDAAAGHVITTMATSPGITHALAFSRGGDKVLAGSSAGARVFDAAGKLLFDLPTQRADLIDAAFSPDGTRVAVSSEDGLVRLWELGHGDLVRVFEGHRDTVMNVDFAPDGSRIVTASLDGTARIWSVQNGRLLSTIVGHEGVVAHAEFDPSGERVATAGLDRSAKIWSARTTRFKALFQIPGPVFAASFSPDGKTLVTSSADGTDRLLDAATGSERAELPVRSGLSLAAFDPRGGELAVPDGHAVRLWDPERGVTVATLEGHDADVIVAAYSADGARLVTGGEDGKAVVWRTDSRRPIATLAGHTGVITSAAFDVAGERVVTSGLDGTVRVWEAATGRQLLRLKQGSAVFRVSLCSDGRRMVVGSTDVLPAIYDVESGAPLLSMSGHKHRVVSVSFSGDCSVVATASADDTVKIWDASDGTLLRSLDIPGPSSVDFDRAGRRLAVAGSDGAVTLFDMSPETRSPEKLARWASCRLPFQVVDGRLTVVTRREDCEGVRVHPRAQGEIESALPSRD